MARRPRQIALHAAVLIVYLVIDLVAFWPLLPGSPGRLFGNATEDPGWYVWSLGWVAHALAHGQNPLFSQAIFVPQGINLAANASAPILGVLMAPLTLLFGPIVSANLLMVLALPISAWAAFCVLAKWQVWRPAAMVGGLIYGFSPYMVGQGLDHLDLVFVPLPPLIVSAVVAIFRGHGSSVGQGAYLGALIAAQFLISAEILATTALLTGVGLLFTAAQGCQKMQGATQHRVVAACVALGITGVLLAYPIWMALLGPQRVTTLDHPVVNAFHNDLLSFVVPGPLQRVTLGMNVLVAGDPTESDGYIGAPVILLAGAFAWRSRGSTRMRAAVVVAGAAALLSLGPYLSVDRHATHVLLPAVALLKVPMFGDILPVRLSFEVDACLAAIVVFGLDDLCRREKARSKWGNRRVRTVTTVCLGTAAVFVGTQLPDWPYVSAAAPRLPAHVLGLVPRNDPVAMTYPYAGLGNSYAMVWQAEDGFRFRLLAGYGIHPGTNGQADAVEDPMAPVGLQQFLAGNTAPWLYGAGPRFDRQLVVMTRVVLQKYDVHLVLVDGLLKHGGTVMMLFTRALGPPQLVSGGFAIWESARHPL